MSMYLYLGNKYYMLLLNLPTQNSFNLKIIYLHIIIVQKINN